MNRALSALGLARRAGKLNWGFDTAVEAMRSGACGVVILAADLSDKTKKNVRFEAESIMYPFWSLRLPWKKFPQPSAKRPVCLPCVTADLRKN